MTRLEKVLIGAITVAALGVGAAIGGAGDEVPERIASAVTTTTDAPTTTTRAPDLTLAPTTTVARTTTTTEYELTDYERELVFLSFVRQEMTYDADVDDATILELAHSVCEAFDVGVSWREIVNTAVITLSASGLGYMADDVAVIYGAGVEAFCPEHSHKIQEGLG